jgi:1-acyl-sn-glycerol-3-phosphate acyltransferase
MFDHPAFATLNRTERTAFRVMRFFNQAGGWRLGWIWQRAVVTPLVGLLFRRRLQIHGLDRLAGVPDKAPILLVANHRTFFDLFTLGWILITHPRLTRRVSFPVRSNFFYETPLGLVMCVLGTGGSMFPPFFRSAEKKAMNRVSLEILLEKLRTPGQLVGFHPEGTRNKTDDPYTPLPAQPGAGELALKARPVIVPAFILGMTNSFGTELKASWRREPKVIAVFGDPIQLPESAGETRLSHHKRFADVINQRITALGSEERAIRSALPASPGPAAK